MLFPLVYRRSLRALFVKLAFVVKPFCVVGWLNGGLVVGFKNADDNSILYDLIERLFVIVVKKCRCRGLVKAGWTVKTRLTNVRITVFVVPLAKRMDTRFTVGLSRKSRC